MAYLGYYRYSNSVGNASKSLTGREDNVQYAFTANLIWQNLKQVPNNYSLGSDYDAFKEEVMDEYNKWDTLPSFNASSQTMNLGQTKELTDTNGVLQYYESFEYTKDKVTFKHNKGSNKMTIKVAADANKESVSVTQSDARNNKMGKYINTRSVQTNFVLSPVPANMATHQRLLVSYGYNDPKYLRININIELYGSLELQKLNTSGNLIDGAIFNVTGPNGYNQDVVVQNGKIVIEQLRPGNYAIFEKSAPMGFLVDTKTYNVEIKANNTSTKAITNVEPTGELVLTKTDKEIGNSERIDGTIHHGDASLKGATYTLYAEEDIYDAARTIKYFSQNEEIGTFTFEENGVATAKITNTITSANISANGSKIIGIPVGKYRCYETRVPERIYTRYKYL